MATRRGRQPINPALTAAEVDYQLADSAARVLVTDNAETATVPAISPSALAEPVDTPAPVVDYYADDALALLIYTSGTTGRPKGVELSHGNIMAMAQSMVAFTKMGADAHNLVILPLFHVNGIVVSVLSPLLAGGQATVAGRFRPSTFFDIVENVRPTYFSAVPAIYTMLAALPDDVIPDVSSVRFAICGAAPIPVELIQAHADLVRRSDCDRDVVFATLQPLPCYGPCRVAACDRDAEAPTTVSATRTRDDGSGCGTSCGRRSASTSGAGRRAPVSDGRRVVFAGLDPHVAKQILYGIFNRSRRGSHTRLQSLQRVVDFVRQFEPTDLNLIF